ncbi:hypothetical protein L1987_24124 [Smallanthus sonchifolius]|uniref:Uncharacterized protein n=1 Tax=Smallanthus sonchifolius TaxID=185202 RepID=A0ACB9IIT9_9ASTR|nr:hypothetical protein L1987_24124 [Smallanthus sonchifolius]
MFKQLKVNLPFIEVLQHMPKYGKFLKDLLSTKKKLEGISKVSLSEQCSAVQLDLGELQPTHMSICLADRSVKYPRGIVENLLVKVGKFIFPVDFVILDMEVDDRVPLIMPVPTYRQGNDCCL